MSRQANLKRTFLINHYFNQRGQALVELATFGTVLLFCLGMLVNYGLQANYQQELEMRAFRQAMQESYNNNSKGPNAGAEANLIEDRVGISTQDAYGVSERYAFGAGSRVTWNNNIMDDYVDEAGNLRYAYLPETDFQINGQNHPYTTADFAVYPCSRSITVRVPLVVPKDGKYWKDVSIDCATQTKVFEEELKDGKKIKVGYIRNMNEGVDKEPINGADVDGDGKQEFVVKVESIDVNGDGQVNDPIQYFVVVDFQEGQIDNTIDPDKDFRGDLRRYVGSRQGLLPSYTKTIHKNAELQKRENRIEIKEESKKEIITATKASSRERITRHIRRQVGTPDGKIIWEEPVVNELSYEKNSTWITYK